MSFNRMDLVQVVMRDSKLKFKKPEAEKFVNDFIEVLIAGLASGENVKLAGLGTFILRDKKERVGRNPKTKEPHMISARRIISFKTSPILKKQLKESII